MMFVKKNFLHHLFKIKKQMNYFYTPFNLISFNVIIYSFRLLNCDFSKLLKLKVILIFMLKLLQALQTSVKIYK